VPKQGIVRKAPKSRTGRRPVVLADEVLAVLREVRAEQARERAILGEAYQDNDLIFCTRDGRPLHAHNLVERDYKPLLKKAGLPPMPFKNLRHSHISHLSRIDAPIAVTQQRAGHSSSKITLDIYTKTAADEQRDAVRRIASELFPATSGHGVATGGQNGERQTSGKTGNFDQDRCDDSSGTS
jgi:integrase